MTGPIGLLCTEQRHQSNKRSSGLHRARQGFVTGRTAQVNQIRGLLAEFGLVMPVGIRSIERKLPEMLEDAENGLLAASPLTVCPLVRAFSVPWIARLKSWNGKSMPGIAKAPASQRLQRIPGIGPLTAERASGLECRGCRRSFTMAANLPRGSGSAAAAEFLPAAKPICSGSASAANVYHTNAVDPRRAARVLYSV